MTITRGFLTYDAEGTEGGTFHSRVLHVPSASSGLTLGRGYDMKEKSIEKIAADLMAAGMAQSDANLLAQASGLSGDAAKAFIHDNELSEFEISIATQEQLFEISYDDMAADVERICNKDDCVAAYGPVDWQGLNPTIRDLLVDLRYRGDYTPNSRKRIQHFVSENDLTPIAQDLADRAVWSQVPQDRFERRRKFAGE